MRASSGAFCHIRSLYLIGPTRVVRVKWINDRHIAGLSKLMTDDVDWSGSGKGEKRHGREEVARLEGQRLKRWNFRVPAG
jgi:hypothetical protein